MNQAALQDRPNPASCRLNLIHHLFESKWFAAVCSTIIRAGSLLPWRGHSVLSLHLTNSHSMLARTFTLASIPRPHLAQLAGLINLTAFSLPANYASRGRELLFCLPPQRPSVHWWLHCANRWHLINISWLSLAKLPFKSIGFVGSWVRATWTYQAMNIRAYQKRSLIQPHLQHSIQWCRESESRVVLCRVDIQSICLP